MKKISFVMTLLWLVCAAFADWAGETSKPSSVDVDGVSYYSITSPEELAWFSEQVKSGKSEINARLENDIVFNEDISALNSKSVSWKSIGDTITRPFNGIFDGNRKTISGLYCYRRVTSKKNIDSTYAGIFGFVGEKGIVKNVSVVNSKIEELIGYGSSGNTYNRFEVGFMGGVVAYNRGLIDNVHISGNMSLTARVSETESYKTNAYGGGLVGYNEGEIRNSSVEGSVLVDHQGKDDLNTQGVGYAGGIVGFLAAGGRVEGCINKSSVTGRGISAAGGVIGGGGKYFKTIDNCKNEGGSVSAKKYAGGVIGVMQMDSSVTISNSSNKASVKTENVLKTFAGGIVGYFYGLNIKADLYLQNVKNSGSVSARCDSSSAHAYASGIAGYVYNSNKGYFNFTNCRNEGHITGLTVEGFAYASGITYISGDAGRIHRCSNTGSVTAKWASDIKWPTLSAVGIAHVSANDTITETFNTGDVSVNTVIPLKSKSQNVAGITRQLSSGYMENVYNWGRISTGAYDINAMAHIGGLAIHSSSIKNSYSSGYISKGTGKYRFVATVQDGEVSSVFYDNEQMWPQNITELAVGLDTRHLQTDSMAWILNTDGGKTKNSGVWSRDDGYPIFADEKNEAIRRIGFYDGVTTQYRYTNNKGVLSDIPKASDIAGQKFQNWHLGETLIDESSHFGSDTLVEAEYVENTAVYSVKFYNADGSLLDSQELVYGAVPECKAVPQIDSTAEFAYVFKQWIPEIKAVDGDAEYTAEFDTITRAYDINFLDYDSSVLKTLSVLYGQTPTYSVKPKRANNYASDHYYTYTFKEWSPEIEPVVGEMSYTAVYDSVKTLSVMVGKHVYNVTKVDTLLWMAENLAEAYDGSYCFNNSGADCDYYGRLYPWNIAEKACPTGWRIPTIAEWRSLASAAGSAKALWGKIHFSGTDAIGFNAVPTAIWYMKGVTGEFLNDNLNLAYFWSSTQYSPTEEQIFRLQENSFSYGYTNKENRLAVRCVKKAPADPSSSSSSVQSSSSVVASSSSVVLSSSSVQSSSSSALLSSSSIVVSSSSEVKSSSSSAVASSSSIASSIYGTLVDSRDSKTYKTIKVDTLEWMAENLNYKASTSYCMSDNSANCDKYGRLYTWSVATSVCPAGWRVPTIAEWKALYAAAGSSYKALWSTSYNSGTDKIGFGGVPTGVWDVNRSSQGYINTTSGFWWSSTDKSSSAKQTFELYSGSVWFGYYSLQSRLAVRCVRKAPAVQSSSSSVVVSSSSEAKSSSSSVVASSSSEAKSSSSLSSSSAVVSSSSIVPSSSSVLESSSSAKSSSSSGDSSSSSVLSCSSDVVSSSSAPSSSSSSEEEEHTTLVYGGSNSGLQVTLAQKTLTVSLESESAVRIQVFDMMGQLLEQLGGTFAGSRDFDLSHLVRGNYIVRVLGRNWSKTVRVKLL